MEPWNKEIRVNGTMEQGDKGKWNHEQRYKGKWNHGTWLYKGAWNKKIKGNGKWRKKWNKKKNGKWNREILRRNRTETRDKSG